MEIKAPITRDSKKEPDDSSWEDVSDGEAEEEQGVARNNRSTVQNDVRIWHRHERLRFERMRDQARSLTTGLPKDGCARREIDKERNCASHFKHPPIDFTRRQIRLVRILPSKATSPIQCEFVLSMVVDPAWPYTALSYAWGTARIASDVVKIVLNGQYFWIRRNLWDFLRRARMDQSLCQGLFWIDALCIDQAGNGVNGLQEKNHQVNLMGEIYSNAREVISWLGEPHLDANIRQELEDLQDYPIYEMSPHEEQSAFRGLYYITDSPYWSRIWIVQEILLAKKVDVRFADYSFSWQELCELWVDQNYGKWALSVGIDSNWSMLPKSQRNASCTLRTQWRKARPIIHAYLDKSTQKYRIIHRVLEFQQQKCSNRLDKVYALLGLVPDQPVVVDYTKTPVQLFEALVRYVNQCISNGEDIYKNKGLMRLIYGRLRIVLGLSREEQKAVLARFRTPKL